MLQLGFVHYCLIRVTPEVEIVMTDLLEQPSSVTALFRGAADLKIRHFDIAVRASLEKVQDVEFPSTWKGSDLIPSGRELWHVFVLSPSHPPRYLFTLSMAYANICIVNHGITNQARLCKQATYGVGMSNRGTGSAGAGTAVRSYQSS